MHVNYGEFSSFQLGILQEICNVDLKSGIEREFYRVKFHIWNLSGNLKYKNSILEFLVNL